MQGRFLFLGTGASMGVPVIGCSCNVCLSSSAKNKRCRSFALLRVNGKAFLLDVAPDFRTQALKYAIQHLDGILITHSHYDHIGGFDDLRIYCFLQKRPLPCLLSRETLAELKRRCHYMMDASQVAFQPLGADFGEVDFEGLKVKWVSYVQQQMKVTGYRLGSFAYISDIREYTQEVIEKLQGIDLLVLSALRHKASDMHFSLEEGITFARKVGAKRTFFTHIAHDLDYEKTNKELPEDIRLAFDGLELEINL